MRFKHFYLSPGGDGGGAGYSLSDLDNDEDAPVKTEEELEAERKAADEEGKTDPDPDETDQEKEAREEEERKKAEKIEADRLAKEEEKKAAAKKKADAEKPEDEEPKGEDDPDPEEEEGIKFWEDVDKLRGESLDVDFGDVDPLSPEGVLIREQAVEARAIGQFEEHLEKTHPKAYAYLLHVSEGGKDEDFFERTKDSTTLPTEEELENDVARQEAIVTQDLKDKGTSDKVIASIIKNAKTEDELEEMAKDALKGQKAKQDKVLADIQKEADDKAAAKTKATKEMSTSVDSIINSGKIGNITIPEKDKPLFAKFIKDSIRWDGGKFIMQTELNNENVLEVFKEKFFSFKKGDLKDLIVQQAKTENANRLRRSIPDKAKPKGTSTSGSTSVGLGEVE